MTAAKKIRVLLVQRDMALKDLAKLLNISAPTLSNKMSRDNFREQDLREIAKVLNFDFDIVFTDQETGETF